MLCGICDLYAAPAIFCLRLNLTQIIVSHLFPRIRAGILFSQSYPKARHLSPTPSQEEGEITDLIKKWEKSQN